MKRGVKGNRNGSAHKGNVALRLKPAQSLFENHSYDLSSVQVSRPASEVVSGCVPIFSIFQPHTFFMSFEHSDLKVFKFHELQLEPWARCDFIVHLQNVESIHAIVRKSFLDIAYGTWLVEIEMLIIHRQLQLL